MEETPDEGRIGGDVPKQSLARALTQAGDDRFMRIGVSVHEPVDPQRQDILRMIGLHDNEDCGVIGEGEEADNTGADPAFGTAGEPSGLSEKGWKKVLFQVRGRLTV